jgi:pyruvate,water dikinase
MNTSPYIKWFADITIDDVPLVGGKNASLGEMVRELASKGVKVPNGFAVTAEAYRHFIREAGIDKSIRALADLDTSDMANLSGRGQAVRQTMLNATIPADLQEVIRLMLRCVPRPPRRICRMQASRASRRPIAMSTEPQR